MLLLERRKCHSPAEVGRAVARGGSPILVTVTSRLLRSSRSPRRLPRSRLLEPETPLSSSAPPGREHTSALPPRPIAVYSALVLVPTALVLVPTGPPRPYCWPLRSHSCPAIRSPPGGHRPILSVRSPARLPPSEPCLQDWGVLTRGPGAGLATNWEPVNLDGKLQQVHFPPQCPNDKWRQ